MVRPEEVFDCPANIFVAGFIGTPQMNFFDAKLEKAGGKYYTVIEGMKIDLPEESQKVLEANQTQPQDVTLGVRPEHIILTEDANEAHVTATIDVSEMMGSSINLHVKVNDQDVVVIVPTMKIKGTHTENFAYGKSINISFDGKMVHLFNKINGDSMLQ